MTKIFPDRKALLSYLGFVTHETNPLPFWVIVTFSSLLTLLILPIGHIISVGYNPQLDEYSDFASIKIYLAILPATILVIYTISKVGLKKYFTPTLLSVLALLALISVYQFVNLSTDFRLKLISVTVYLVCSGLLGYSFYLLKIWPKYKELICWTLILNGALQSALAIIQFYLQHSLGLNLIGESPISINQYGVAKIILESGTFIRSYGTSPHPNILSAFLFIITLLNLYLLNNTIQTSKRIAIGILFFVNMIGVFLTLSRGGIIALSLGLAILLIAILVRRSRTFSLNMVLFLCFTFVIPFFIFQPWLIQRINVNDNSVAERVSYYEAGKEIVLNNWFIGTGAGTNLFHMKQLLENKLEPWNIQPIHNFILISWSELGLISLIPIVLIVYLLYRILRKSLSNLYRGSDIFIETSLFLAIFTGIILLFWLDHYFYTYWPIQAFMWILLGMGFSMVKED